MLARVNMLQPKCGYIFLRLTFISLNIAFISTTSLVTWKGERHAMHDNITNLPTNFSCIQIEGATLVNGSCVCKSSTIFHVNITRPACFALRKLLGTLPVVQLYTNFFKDNKRFEFHDNAQKKLLKILQKYCSINEGKKTECQIDKKNEFLTWKEDRWVKLEETGIRFLIRPLLSTLSVNPAGITSSKLLLLKIPPNRDRNDGQTILLRIAGTFEYHVSTSTTPLNSTNQPTSGTSKPTELTSVTSETTTTTLLATTTTTRPQTKATTTTSTASTRTTKTTTTTTTATTITSQTTETTAPTTEAANTTLPTTKITTKEENKIRNYYIIIPIIAVFTILLLLLACFFLNRKRKRNDKKKENEEFMIEPKADDATQLYAPAVKYRDRDPNKNRKDNGYVSMYSAIDALTTPDQHRTDELPTNEPSFIQIELTETIPQDEYAVIGNITQVVPPVSTTEEEYAVVDKTKKAVPFEPPRQEEYEVVKKPPKIESKSEATKPQEEYAVVDKTQKTNPAEQTIHEHYAIAEKPVKDHLKENAQDEYYEVGAILVGSKGNSDDKKTLQQQKEQEPIYFETVGDEYGVVQKPQKN